jgi:rhodanese-related sulfurtransferase
LTAQAWQLFGHDPATNNPMRRIIVRMLIIAWASAALGLGVNAVRSDIDAHGNQRRLPLVTPAKRVVDPDTVITLSDAELLWNAGLATFLDARSRADYREGHVALAYSLPGQMFESAYAEIAGLLTRSGAIVVYCDGVECELSHEVADRLETLGYENVRILINGWTVWREAGLPTTSGDQP